MVRILVLASDYPDLRGHIPLFFVHSRNKYYQEQLIDVSVLSFATQEDYVVDKIPVYSLKTFRQRLVGGQFDLLLVHAPNLRNHFPFLMKYHHLFPRIIFFFHGHEVLRCTKVYPEPYPYFKGRGILTAIVRDWYDVAKLRIWKSVFERLSHKSWFVFVSEWMQEQFMYWVRTSPANLQIHTAVIYNCVGSLFEVECYDSTVPKKYDFVTIRRYLDWSKYGIDIVARLAEKHSQYTFCVVGTGAYFEHHPKPDNLILIEKHLTHEEIVTLLNQSKCALLPTRADAQGVTGCEIATFGIPLITSNIPVCREVFSGFENVRLINNDESGIDLGLILEELECFQMKDKNLRFAAVNTSGKEVELMRSLM